jgi:two-component system, OmpR family, sensor histidine kinase KdpD
MERRKNPKELLEYVQKQEQSETQGRLKVFLGAAPGVGKTYAMLEEAVVRLKKGVDVVAGLVETHNRKETQEFLNKLEVLPRRKVEYRGRILEEFDLDQALIRNPSLILVDEMAHTNAPGSRHNKRWQDIVELLDRGIDVYTTVNVQHIESLNNVIMQITGITVRETIPDTLMARATAVELIDLPPHDLLKRLEEGKVYVPADVAVAIENYFKQSNLTALRELSLRFTAEQVDKEVLLQRRGESIKKIWPTKERLLVCVGPDPMSAKLIRAAFRMAKNLRAEWIALCIETPSLRASPLERHRVVEHLRLAEQLGAENLMLGGTDIANEIIHFAHERNVTKIILSKQSKSRWHRLFHPSLADELIHYSSDIDLYILRKTTETESVSKREVKVETPKFAYLLSLIVVAICTGIDLLLSPFLESSVLIMVYILGVIYVSLRGFNKPAFLASILSVLAFGYFFVPPHFTWMISDIQYIITLCTMLLVSQVIAHLTVVNKQQAEFSRWREYRIASQHLLSKELAKTRGVKQLLEIVIHHISEVFNASVWVFLPDDSGKLRVFPTESGEVPESAVSTKDQSVALWVFELGQMAGLGTQTLQDNKAIFIPLLGTKGAVGVLRVLPRDPERLLIPDQLHLLEAFANQAAMALEVDWLEEEANKKEMKIESDRVNNILMKYISDNMRAPLLDIVGLSNELIETGQSTGSAAVRELSEQIHYNSEELNHLINNLSQIARLEEQERAPTKNLHSIERTIDEALTSLDRRLGKRVLSIDVPESLPKIYFHKVHIEQVLYNIIENAIKYTPEGSPINIKAKDTKENIVVSIADRGPGVALEEINKIFEKFYRGQSIAHIKGMGLGLAICQRIITMHGGEIWAENRDGGGTVFRFTLPKKL